MEKAARRRRRRRRRELLPLACMPAAPGRARRTQILDPPLLSRATRVFRSPRVRSPPARKVPAAPRPARKANARSQRDASVAPRASRTAQNAARTVGWAGAAGHRDVARPAAARSRPCGDRGRQWGTLGAPGAPRRLLGEAARPAAPGVCCPARALARRGAPPHAPPPPLRGPRRRPTRSTRPIPPHARRLRRAAAPGLTRPAPRAAALRHTPRAAPPAHAHTQPAAEPQHPAAEPQPPQQQQPQQPRQSRAMAPPSPPPARDRVLTLADVAALAAEGRAVYICDGRVFDVDLDAIMHPGGRDVRRALGAWPRRRLLVSGGGSPGAPRLAPKPPCQPPLQTAAPPPGARGAPRAGHQRGVPGGGHDGAPPQPRRTRAAGALLHRRARGRGRGGGRGRRRRRGARGGGAGGRGRAAAAAGAGAGGGRRRRGLRDCAASRLCALLRGGRGGCRGARMLPKPLEATLMRPSRPLNPQPHPPTRW
jgi:hypothetical protein